VDLPVVRRIRVGRLRAPAIPLDAPDEVLLAAMAQGDEDAVVAFVRRYERRVVGLAWTMLGDPGLAEEVAQEAFVRAWRHAAAFDPRRAAAATWLLTIARNLAIDRARLRRPVPVSDDDLAHLVGAGHEAFEADSDRRARLREMLALIPLEQRRAVVLAAAYGYTAAEISEVEAIPLGTAKTRIRSGLGKLRRLLEDGAPR
jgi:RNA polymerase sigma factor (sigma-70 family)